jgi:hypothetical protein
MSTKNKVYFSLDFVGRMWYNFSRPVSVWDIIFLNLFVDLFSFRDAGRGKAWESFFYFSLDFVPAVWYNSRRLVSV